MPPPTVEHAFYDPGMEPRAEHVYVTDVRTADGSPAPGLLVGWQRVKGRWQGLVIAAAMMPDPEAGPMVTMHWVDEGSIRRRGPGDDSAVWLQRPVTPRQAAAPATAPPTPPSGR